MARRDAFETPHGRCVIVELDGDGPVLDGERAMVEALAPGRRREFLAGRAAMRAALATEAAILSDDRGAPVLPAGWVGSISHKGAAAAALVARAGAWTIGVDLEAAVAARLPIERRILTPRERAVTGRAVTLRFAIKEAIYKAVDPIVRRYVGFTEVELDVAVDGGCRVEVVDPDRLPVTVEACWQERDGMWLATARAKRR